MLRIRKPFLDTREESLKLACLQDLGERVLFLRKLPAFARVIGESFLAQKELEELTNGTRFSSNRRNRFDPITRLGVSHFLQPMGEIFAGGGIPGFAAFLCKKIEKDAQITLVSLDREGRYATINLQVLKKKGEGLVIRKGEGLRTHLSG